MTTHEISSHVDDEHLLGELSVLIRTNHTAKTLQRQLAELHHPDGNMTLHAKQNDVLIEHTDRMIATIQQQLKELEPTAKTEKLTPTQLLQFHRECIEQLCIMKAQLLENDKVAGRLKSNATTDANGEVVTYLDPFIAMHLRRVSELVKQIPA